MTLELSCGDGDCSVSDSTFTINSSLDGSESKRDTFQVAIKVAWFIVGVLHPSNI